MARWPKDTQEARNAFYGDPAYKRIEGQLVAVVPPFKMYYDNKLVSYIRFHPKAAPALKAALDEIWEAYNHDQAEIDRAGISEFGGAYNHRLVRGSSTKWSNHAYGAAIDISPTRNGMGTRGDMPQTVIDAFTRQGAMWGGWYSGRTDPMHFEFVDNGGRQPKFPPPGSATAAKKVQPLPVTHSPIVEELQRTLIDMGYHEVGGVDGLLGTKTEGAITMFLRDSGLQSYTTLATLLTYAKQKRDAGFQRPVTPARAYATADDVDSGSIRQNAWTRLWGRLMAVPSTVGAAIWGVVGVLPDAQDSLTPYFNIVRGAFTNIPGWVWLVAVAVAGFAIWYSANRSDAETVSDYQKGRLN